MIDMSCLELDGSRDEEFSQEDKNRDLSSDEDVGADNSMSSSRYRASAYPLSLVLGGGGEDMVGGVEKGGSGEKDDGRGGGLGVAVF